MLHQQPGDLSPSPSPQYSMGKPGVPIRGAVVSASQETDDVRDTVSGPYAAVLWPFAAFRACFDNVAAAVALESLEAFLASPHAWCPVPDSCADSSPVNSQGASKHRRKRQVPPTPWTQAHPTAVFRPRTSVRLLMLNQKVSVFFLRLRVPRPLHLLPIYTLCSFPFHLRPFNRLAVAQEACVHARYYYFILAKIDLPTKQTKRRCPYLLMPLSLFAPRPALSPSLTRPLARSP